MAYYKVQDKSDRTIKETASKKEAEAYFKKSSRANFIQTYTRKGGATSGILQPGIPKTIKVGGKSFDKAYVGFRTKREAEKFVKGGDGKLVWKSRKFKQGYILYARTVEVPITKAQFVKLPATKKSMTLLQSISSKGFRSMDNDTFEAKHWVFFGEAAQMIRTYLKYPASIKKIVEKPDMGKFLKSVQALKKQGFRKKLNVPF